MKRFLSLVLLMAGLVSAQETSISVPNTRFVLPNGLTVILHEDHTVPAATVNVWYHVGSGREKPNRTGFAHLFEHIMFEGSGNVPEGKFDEWLEAAGGDNNGSTTTNRTNYYENIPSNAVELALFLESDRMGYLLTAMSPAKVDGQRDVVKNERRQRMENQPYGMVSVIQSENMYPPDHPYHWPTIGYMPDLTAASYDDVVDFFKKYYVPNNASLCVAGDINPAMIKALVEKWFTEIPSGAPVPRMNVPTPTLAEEKRLVYEDNVQLPRLYIAWHSPAIYTAADAQLDVLADILAGGKNSRLYKRLVYDLQIAQDVSAFQASESLSSTFEIVATARTGHTLAELERVIQEEVNKIRTTAPEQREVQRAVNQFEASFLNRIERIGGKADQLNGYYFYTGNPDYFNDDLRRYKTLTATDVKSVAETFLKDNARLVLSVVPKGKKELSAAGSKEVTVQ